MLWFPCIATSSPLSYWIRISQSDCKPNSFIYFFFNESRSKENTQLNFSNCVVPGKLCFDAKSKMTT